MRRRPPRPTRTDTLVPYTPLFRSLLPLFTAVGTFSFAAVAAAVLLVALARSPQTRESPDGVERRRLLPAIAAGMSYALRTPALRAILVRTASVCLPASALLALLPTVASERMRSEESRVGEECGRKCGSRWSPHH